jgi:hypothetical protein
MEIRYKIGTQKPPGRLPGGFCAMILPYTLERLTWFIKLTDIDVTS